MRNDETGTSLRSVENALRVLASLLNGRPLRVMDVAADLGVARSTAHRLLSTLRSYGFVSQGPDKRYRAGPALVKAELAPLLRPLLERLAAELDETVQLMVLEGRNIRFVDSVEAQRPLRVGSRVGRTLPAHLTSGGKILLAQLTPVQLEALYADTPVAEAPDLSHLRTVLEESGKMGYAFNIEESEPGICAVAAAVLDPFGRPIAAIAIAAPSVRATAQDLSRFGEIVKAVADRAGEDLWEVE
jgi:IclR family acetate operon transcriptional repressor